MLKIVLLPGMDGSGAFFIPFIEAISPLVGTQIISYPGDQALNYVQLTQHVLTLLPKDSPFVILGESFSGPIAISIAATKPPGLKALILVCTFVCSPIPLPKIFRNIASHFPVSLIPSKIIAHYLLGYHSTAKIKADLAKALSKVKPDVWQERLHSILSVNVSTLLSRIEVPILYIRASQDKIVRKSASDLISLKQPNVRVTEIEGPHFILQTNPTAAVSCISDFLTDAGIIPEQTFC